MPFVVRLADLVQRGLPESEAQLLLDVIPQWLTADHLSVSPMQMVHAWRELSQRHLTPNIPFAVHRYVYDAAFSDWPASEGPRPAWQPDAKAIQQSAVGKLMQARGFARVADLHAWSVADREGFWSWGIEHLKVVFDQPPSRVLEASSGAEQAVWLPGARLNIVSSCFQAPPDTPALLWHEPRQTPVATTYAELQQQTARVVAALTAAGFVSGDALAINMPMTPESVAIYLGIVAAGMVVVSIADSMAPEEIRSRLSIAQAKAIFTVFELRRGGKRLAHYEKVQQAQPPRAIVLGAVEQSLRSGDVTWEAFIAAPVTPVAWACKPAAPDGTTNILFSSGTTGEPKAIPWTHLTPIKAAVDAALALDVQAGDVVAWPTNLGWMMGPWLIYAALLNRATIALFSDAPTTAEFGRFVQDARVNVLGLVPSIVKAWREDDRMIGFDWRHIKCFGSTGEASNADDYLYLMMLAGYRPVIEYCGGTEIGGGYITGSLVQAASPSTFSTPAMGSDFVLLDEQGAMTNNGEVFLIPPTLGYSQRLLNRDHHEVYFAGAPCGPQGQVLRRHGDQIERLPNGFFRAHGRVDDTMNLGGIKVSSAEIERVLDGVAGMRRSAAVAIAPPGGGPSLLVIYAVADAGLTPDDLKPRLQTAIKEKLNPLFRIAELILIDAMPVTASNKIMRRELRARAEAELHLAKSP